MARIASRASAGYYPLPLHLCEPVAALVQPHKDRLGSASSSALDPCCGKGEVLGPLASAGFRAVGVELERGRAEAANKLPRVNVTQGDAFRVEPNFQVSALYLNPPYDDDRVYGRVEHKFLKRFTGFLLADGVLIFVVPLGAIPASAEYLARNYSGLECWKFPDEDFPIYKQVIIRGIKRAVPLPFVPETERVVLEQWALGVAPVFVPGAVEPLTAPESFRYPNPVINAVDMETVRKEFRPFVQTLRYGAPSHLKEFCPAPGEDLFCDGFRSAMPPLPPHLAPAIAAGAFNGEEIPPDRPESGLPRLLVKGVFTRHYAVKDENVGEDGRTTSILQQQEPRLDVTVLDLERLEFHDLINSSETTDSPGVEGMSIADLFARYGKGLLAILNRKCVVDYDPRVPSSHFPLPTLARPLFEAQEHAVRGALTQLGGPGLPFRSRRDRACVVLGEIGSGKTSVALATMYSAGAPKVVVMCPPHLLKSWEDQTGAVLGLAGRVMLLETEADVRAFVEYERKGGMPMLVAIFSREKAKLGHSFASVTGGCPGCGGPLPSGNLAARRARCKNLLPKPQNLEAELLSSLVGHVPVPAFCVEGSRLKSKVNYLLTLRQAQGEEVSQRPEARAALEGVAVRLLRIMETRSDSYASTILPLLNHYLATLDDPAGWILAQYKAGAVPCLDWLALLSVCGDREAYAEARAAVLGGDSYNYHLNQVPFRDSAKERVYSRGIDARIEGGRVIFQGDVNELVAALGKNASFAASKCGEFLFQAVPAPRRYPLSKTFQKLARKHNLDFGLVLDEAHEFATDGSAQEISAHRLASLRPPTLLLSGSIMNGRAESLFTNWWASVKSFREAFGRDDAYRFVDEYGFRKRLVQITDAVPEAVARGATTDRKDIPSIDRGSAPGVMPGFILKYLLPVSVTMRVEDVKELPPYKEIQIDLLLGSLGPDHRAMMTALLDRITEERFDPELGGALFGQLSEAPSQPDRATVDTGNQPDGSWKVIYPERVHDIVPDPVVYTIAPLPESFRTPKEAKLLEIVRSELAEGRRAMVFVWNINLIPRIKRLLEAEFPGEAVVHLDTGKVATGAREAWIDKEVVRKGVRLMIANPVGIQTGLNNLTHFDTIVWYQNPAINPTIFVQANGRIRRIGQTKEARVYFLSYAACAQEAARVLLMDKASVAASVNGLDPMGALQAAGVGTSSFSSGLSVAKALHKMMTEGTRYRRGEPAAGAPLVVKDSTKRSPILEVLGYDWLLP